MIQLLMILFTLTFSGKNAENVHDFKFKTIDGEEVSLGDFKGKKLLLVNTASKCGFTKQYAGLQELSEKYGDKLIVIGFPSGDFGNQELDTGEEIQNFCEKNFGVTFLLSEKTKVKGQGISPLFAYLTSTDNPDFKGDIKWNFEKFLVDENGKLIHRFRSATDPMDEDILSKV